MIILIDMDLIHKLDQNNLLLDVLNHQEIIDHLLIVCTREDKIQ